MRPRVIIYIVIIAIVVAVGFYVYSLFFGKSVTTQPGGGQLPINIGTSTPPNFPTGSSVVIGTQKGSVTVNNFYKNAVSVTPDNKIVFFGSTSDYNLTYYVPDGTFSIALLSEPVSTARTRAEEALLQILGIDQNNACKLNVYEGVPVSIDPAYAGKNLGLSFCTNALK